MTGITNIIEIINTKTAEQEKEIISEAEKFKAAKLDEAKRRADETATAITRKAELQAESELSKYEASAKLKSKYKMLEAKDALINEVLETTQKQLESVVGKAEYKKILERLIVTGCVALGVESVELIFPEKHKAKVELADIEKAVAKEGKKVKISISKETVRSIGGVIIRTKDGTKWVDDTFEARLERFESKSRDTISDILFKA
ncbi:MAG: V-type ATP synthase subunit E family protein [Candidatus Thorarchaeota archaeon]